MFINVVIYECSKYCFIINFICLFQALDIIEEISEVLGLKYSQRPRHNETIVYGSEDELE